MFTFQSCKKMTACRKRLQCSSCLALCFFIVITPALGAEHDKQVQLPPLVEEDHHNSGSGFSVVKRVASELFCDFRRIFGWCQDNGKDRQKRSFLKEREQSQDDNTNPDEPNPKILVRVPRQRRHAGHSRKSGQRTNRRRVAHLGKKPQRRRFSKKGGSISGALLKNRMFGGGSRRKSKRVVFNGKWYGPKRKRAGNGPPPRVVNHLAHLRKPLTDSERKKQQRRFVTNRGYLHREAKKKWAREGNARMAKIRKQMKEQRRKNQAAKEDYFSESYSSASSSSFSFDYSGSASADSASYSYEDVVQVRTKKPKRPPKPKFAWSKHKHSHSPGQSHGNKKGRIWSKKFRPRKMTSRGRR